MDSTVTENTAPFGAGLSSLGTTEIVGSTTSNNTSTELTGLRPDGRDCGRRGDRTPDFLRVNYVPVSPDQSTGVYEQKAPAGGYLAQGLVDLRGLQVDCWGHIGHN